MDEEASGDSGTNVSIIQGGETLSTMPTPAQTQSHGHGHPQEQQEHSQHHPHQTTLLSLCYDILLLLCAHLSLSRAPWETPILHLCSTSRHLRTLLSPWLFKTLHINTPVKMLQYSPMLAVHARTLKMDLFGSMWWWCSGEYVNGQDAVDVFGLVGKLGNVRALEVSMMRRSVGIFERAVGEGEFFCAEKEKRRDSWKTGSDSEEGKNVFILDKIETLQVTSSAAFLATHCPNLRCLEIKDGDDCTVEPYMEFHQRLAPLASHNTQQKHQQSSLTKTPQLALHLPAHLTHLTATALWSLPGLLFLTSSFPYLTHLSLLSDSSRYHAPLSTIIALLSSTLHSLHTLRLTKLSDLDLGFRPVLKMMIQRCQVSAQRKRLWRENEVLRVRAENELAREVFAACKGVRELWVGEGRVARRIRGGSWDGGNETRWMWERERDIEIWNRELGSKGRQFYEERNAVVVRREVGM